MSILTKQKWTCSEHSDRPGVVSAQFTQADNIIRLRIWNISLCRTARLDELLSVIEIKYDMLPSLFHQSNKEALCDECFRELVEKYMR